MFKNLFKKLQLCIMATLSAIILTGASVQAAEKIDYQTYYDVSDVKISNENNLIYVRDGGGDIVFIAKPCYEKIYTTERLNLRNDPNINTEIICTLPKNAEVLRVGTTKVGWDIIQIDNVNYFMWNEFLSTESDDTLDITEVTTIEPFVYRAAATSTGVTQSSVINSNSYDGSYLGAYMLTAYCNCSTCCGKWAGGGTASGTYPTAGRTVAADLPFGTQLLINGNVYTVEDRGVSGNHIDIYFNSHSEALAFGLQYADVYILQ